MPNSNEGIAMKNKAWQDGFNAGKATPMGGISLPRTPSSYGNAKLNAAASSYVEGHAAGLAARSKGGKRSKTRRSKVSRSKTRRNRK